MATAIAVLDAVRERVADEDRHGRGLRPHLVLRQRRRALRRGAREAARDGACCGRSSAASATASPTRSQLRFRYGVQVNSLGLTEAQPENNVQRIVLEALAVTLGRDARARAIQLPGLERGARPAAPVGPAVVAAHPAGARLRDRPARVPRHLRGLEGHGRARRPSCSRARAPRWPSSPSTAARSRPCDYMKAALVESHRERMRAHRGRRADRRRPEPLHRDRAVAAHGRAPTAASWSSTPGVEAEQREALERVARRARRAPPSTRRWTSCAGSPPPTRTSCRRRSPPPARAPRPASGRTRCATCSASTARPTGVGEAAAGAAAGDLEAAARRGRARRARRSGGG